jgi:hypothetical protein
MPARASFACSIDGNVQGSGRSKLIARLSRQAYEVSARATGSDGPVSSLAVLPNPK